MRIRDAFFELLDVIVPRRDRTRAVETLSIEKLPIVPQAQVHKGVRITSLMSFEDRQVQQTIHALKYDGSTKAAALLAGALQDYLFELLAEGAMYQTKEVVLVPLPLHASRLRERGFNQTDRILRELPVQLKKGDMCRIDDSLQRIRATKAQTRLSRRERFNNIKGAFALRGTYSPGTLVYIVDDVTTTGATLAEAVSVFRAKGIEAEGIALARAKPIS